MTDGTTAPEEGDDPSAGRRSVTPATVEDIVADLDDLAEDDDDPDRQAEIHDVHRLLAEARDRGLIDSGVRHLNARDVAEAFVGSVIVATPLLVEDGIFDIADHLFESSVAGLPLFLVANTAFVVVMTYAMLEWTGRNRDESWVLFGVVPARVVMILAVSFGVATALMTVWGRVDWLAAPVEGLARVNVLWTIGSLGAALGDVLAQGDPGTDDDFVPDDVTTESPSTVGTDVASLTNPELLAALHRELDDVKSLADDAGEREAVDRIRTNAVAATMDEGFGDEINKYTSRDLAEAFVGSIFFAIPFLVEDGVFDVAAYFLSFTVGVVPVFFLVNAAFVVVMIMALVFWAGPQHVQVSRPILGVVPRRLLGIAVVSFLTAAALAVLWGRVTGAEDPVVALARISVVWTVASFGAALGDILPGESSGDDINDDLAALAEFVGDEDGTTD